MADEYRVVRYAPEHRNAVLDLHVRLLPRARRVTERYFAWKYEENPYIPEPLLALVFTGDALVGMRGLCGTEWRDVDGMTQVVPAAEDLIVDPGHLNRGLFVPIDRELRRIAVERGHGTMLSLSASSTTRRLQEVAGWRRVASSRRTVRPARQTARGVRDRRAVRSLRFRARSLRRRTGVVVPERIVTATVDRVLAGMEGTAPQIEVERKADAARFAALAASWAGARYQPHTEEFYRWRLANPDRRYRFVTWRDPRMRGYVIVGLQPDDPTRVLIVDAAADDDEILVALLESVVRASRPSLTVLPDALPEPVRGELRGMGFEPGDEDGEAMVVVFERATAKSAAPPASDWYVSLLDTMLG
jgi:hypothetical protein